MAARMRLLSALSSMRVPIGWTSKIAASELFRERQRRTVDGAKALAEQLLAAGGDGGAPAHGVKVLTGGRGQQTGPHAEILSGNRIRSTTGGISLDRLPVREVDDRQQHNDGKTDGNDVGGSSQAKGYQDGERSFRAVGC